MGGFFGGGSVPAPAPIPIPEAPKATPMVDEKKVRDAKNRKIAASQQRGGRGSTILGESDTLG